MGTRLRGRRIAQRRTGATARNRKVPSGGFLLAALIVTGAGTAQAQLTVFSDRGAFTGAAPTLQVETFNRARSLSNNFNAPLSSTTTNIGASGAAVFLPGDIQPGVQFSALSSSPFNLRVDSINGSPILQTPSGSAKLVVDFTSDDIRAVSLDAFQFNAAGNITIDVFGLSGVLLGTASVFGGPTTPGFFGATSAQSIKRLVINDSDILPGIDNVAFGPYSPLLDFVTSPASFQSDASNLRLETFNNARSLNNNFNAPLSNTTTNIGASGASVFLPGDIVPGVQFSGLGGFPFNLRVMSANGSPILTTPNAGEKLVVSFDGDAVTAVSLDAFQFNASGFIAVDVYGPGDVLLGTTSVFGGPTTPGYFGVLSRGTPIRKLVIDDRDILPAIDNVAFGQRTSLLLAAAPEPSGAVLAVPCLMLLALRGVARRNRRI